MRDCRLQGNSERLQNIPPILFTHLAPQGGLKGQLSQAKNICHYLRAANEIYSLSQYDVTFQGASLAFDLSMEEIWITYLSGGALFVATSEMLADTEALPEVLEQAGVTVLDTVPRL